MSPELLNYLMGAAIVALIGDHILIRTRLATHVTAEQMQNMERRVTEAVASQFTALHTELGVLARDLAYLRGTLRQQQPGD